VVEFEYYENDSMSCVDFAGYSCSLYADDWGKGIDKHHKVVGNIYENPELLRGHNEKDQVQK